jgi:hypothetical protein
MSNPVRLFALAMLVFVAGCDPTITALTAAPPTAVAEMDSFEETVRISQGIAFAVECKYESNPCEDAEATSSDTAIAQVFPAFVDILSPGDTYQSGIAKRARSAFVIVGGKPGDATVTITTSSGDGDVDLAVTTVALP